MFVSGLSVNELVLSSGLHVLGIVSGSVVHPKAQLEPAETSRVLKTAARRRSRIIALASERLQENAAQRGATGILGVQVHHRLLDSDWWEYTMTGTAIYEAGREPSAKPVVCTLSGQDYGLLLSGGYRPTGLAFGIGIYSQKLHQVVQREMERGLNTERSDFTLGLYRARRHAFDALHQNASELNAQGILGVYVGVERSLHRLGKFNDRIVISIVAAGTAVVSCPGSEMTVDYAVPLNR